MKRIMVVEDETAIREFEVINLKRVGYSVVEAGSGEEALDIYDSDAEGFDIALLDISMPGMDGFTLCKELRRRSDEHTGFVSVYFAQLFFRRRVFLIVQVEFLTADHSARTRRTAENGARLRVLLRACLRRSGDHLKRGG